MGLLGEIYKKTGAGKAIPCKSYVEQPDESHSASMIYALLRMDYVVSQGERILTAASFLVF